MTMIWMAKLRAGGMNYSTPTDIAEDPMTLLAVENSDIVAAAKRLNGELFPPVSSNPRRLMTNMAGESCLSRNVCSVQDRSSFVAPITASAR